MDAVLRLELPTPYPVGTVNAWWLDGPEPVLIDTGVPTRANLEILEAALAVHGRSLGDVRRILLTHDHADHAGAASAVARRSGAPVHMHARGRLGPRWKPEEIQALARFLLRCGMPADVLAGAGEALRRDARYADADPVVPEPLWGGEILDSPLGPLTVLATPGHSHDHLSYLAIDAGLLFCGDTLLPYITPNPILHLDPDAGFRRVPSLLQHLESLRTLAALPVRRAHPGHGPDLLDVAGRVAHDLAFVQARQGVFLAAIRRGADTPWSLAQAVFGDQDPTGRFLAVSETVAYLDLLERDAGLDVRWEADPIRVGRT
ncbi:MAG: MBL fold metallo-hydrolase [Deltaproteobacteria bacterium]|nr:MBL fold metallo-hydrolase [Deltaproteobacteria bacterium]